MKKIDAAVQVILQQFAILSNLPSIFSIQFGLENVRRPDEHNFDKFLLFRALHRDLARI